MRAPSLAGKFLALLASCLLLLSLPAHAGRSCEAAVAKVENIVKAMDLALQTRQALQDSGAKLALIARVGQDLSEYGLVYSHMAFVWRDHPKGTWLVVHALNQCGTANAQLYDEGLGNFFLDDMFAYKSQILIPTPEVQEKLIATLAGTQFKTVFSSRYNMLSYPFSTQYQNSNQWVLETYAAAQLGGQLGGQTAQRSQAQAWLRQAGYTPITLHVPAIKRLGARMFSANIAFDDQPFARRMAGKIDTVTVESVTQFLRQHQDGVRVLELQLQAGK